MYLPWAAIVILTIAAGPEEQIVDSRAESAVSALRRSAKQTWRATSKHLPPRVAEGIRVPAKRLLRSVGLIAKP
jgi:hypothetical protein